MKTIQKQRRELTALSRNSRLMAFVVAISFICHICTTGCVFNKSNEFPLKIYENYEEIEKNFYENKEEFQQAVFLLAKSELFDYLWTTTHEEPAMIYYEFSQMKKFYSSEDYNFFCDFLKEQGFYEIGKCFDSVYFVLLGVNIDVVIYYTEMESDPLSRFLTYIGQRGNVKKIDDNWYCKYNYADVTRT